jgi:hypothetical protein
VRVSGGLDVGRVAPAVAEDSTNAMGLFDVEAISGESGRRRRRGGGERTGGGDGELGGAV